MLNIKRYESKSVTPTQISPDKYGFDFDGSTNVSFYTNPTLSLQNMSVYMKFKVDSIGNQSIINWTQIGGANFGRFDMTFGASTYNFTFIDSAGNNTIIGDNFSVGNVIDVCVTLSATNAKIFVNGSLVNTITNNCNADNISFANFAHYIGGVSSTFFDGVVADVSFYNTALPDQDAIDMTGGNGLITTNRVFYESFNNTTLGTVTGTEQYSVIENTAQYEASINFYGHLFGGVLAVSEGQTSTKTVQLFTYVADQERFYLDDTQTATGESVNVTLPDSERRFMRLTVTSDTNFSEINYTIDVDAYPIDNNDVVNIPVSTYDTSVFYGVDTILDNSLRLSIAKESAKEFRTIIADKTYINGVKYEVMSHSFNEFDITRYEYNLSLKRLMQ